MSHIFISYANKDKDFASAIVQALGERNLDTWIDWKDIPGGTRWEDEIYRAIEEADAFLFFISPDSVRSAMCKKEIQCAAKNHKRLVTILIRDTDRAEIPLSVLEIQWIRCRAGVDDFGQAIEEVQKAIHTDFDWLQYHRVLQVKALEWAKDYERSLLLRGKELQRAELELATNSSKDPLPTDLQRQYVFRSRQVSEQLRNTQLRIAAVVGIVMALLAAIAFTQRDRAIANQRLAEERATISRSQALASDAVSLRDTSFPTSLLLGVEAFRVRDTPQARSILLSNLQVNVHLKSYLMGHADWVRSVTFSPDGRYLASGSFDGTIILWDVGTGRAIGQPVPGPQPPLWNVAFSPTTDIMAVPGSDNAIVLWDMRTARPIGGPLTKPTTRPARMAFSSDGTRLISAGNDDTIILWDLSTRRAVGQPLTGYSLGIFSPDGKVLALIGQEGSTVLMDAKTLQTIGEPIRGYPDAFSKDGKTLVLSSQDGSIILWNVGTHRPSGSQLTENHRTQAVTFSPIGNLLALRDYQASTVEVWDTRTLQPIGQPFSDNSTVAFSPDGRMLALGTFAGDIILWDTEAHRPIGQPLKGHSGEVWSLVFSPDSRMLASGSTDKTIILWDLNANGIIGRSLGEQPESGAKLAYSANGDYLASTDTSSGTITLWNLKTREPIDKLGPADSRPVSSIAFSPNGKILAAGRCLQDKPPLECARGEISLWNVQTRQPAAEPLLGGYELALSPDGRTLASSGIGNTISLWDLVTRQAIGQLQSPDPYSAHVLIFSPDGKLLASGGCAQQITHGRCIRGQIAFWNMETKQLVDQPLLAHSDFAEVAFSPDGSVLASGGCGMITADLRCTEGEIILWDVKTHTPIGRTMRGHSGPISALAFSPDGRILASGSEYDDNSIILWDVATGEAIGQPLRGHTEGISSLAFSPDGKVLASGNYQQIILWNVDPLSWIQEACRRAGRNLTRAEWTQYFPNQQYRKTCDQWGMEQEVVVTPGSRP